MKAVRVFVLVVIVLLAVSAAASPAIAWYWPIMGFSQGWGMPPVCIGGPSVISPGTPEWALQPSFGASLVPFGYPYGQIQGSLNVGLVPSLGSTSFGNLGGIGLIG